MASVVEYRDFYWVNKSTKTLKGQLVYSDGRITPVIAIPDNDTTVDGVYDLVMKNVGIKQVDANTDRKLKTHRQVQKQRQVQAKEAAELRRTEELFTAKVSAFEIDEVRSSSHRVLKTKLRKAKNLLEVTAVTAAIILDYVNNEQKETTE